MSGTFSPPRTSKETYRQRSRRASLWVSDPDMHHGTHVPWCMSGSLTHSGGENVPGIPGACAARNFTYLARGPWDGISAWKIILLTHLPPGQNGRHFAGDIFLCIFMNEKFCILIKISQLFVSKGLIDNKTPLVQVMAWHRTGDKPLPEPMLI